MCSLSSSSSKIASKPSMFSPSFHAFEIAKPKTQTNFVNEPKH
jgi:hypothetical protein